MSNGKDSIANLAWDLRSRISKVVIERMGKRLISRKTQLYRKLVVTDFRYGPRGSGFQTRDETVEKKVWDSFNIHDIYKTSIQPLPETENLTELISRKCGLQSSLAEYRVQSLALAMIRGTLEEMKDRGFNDLIVTFNNDLTGGPVRWHIKSHIEGVWLETENIELLDGTILRKPTPGDLEREVPFEVADIGLRQECVHVPGAILEFDLMSKSNVAPQTRVMREILALRLYDVGSIYSLVTHYDPHSFLTFSHSISHHRGYSATRKYTIDSERVAGLKDFMDKVGPIIPAENILQQALPQNHLTIALRRYSDALLKPDPPESRLTFAIMGLEALYLKSDERAELSLRLSQRTGMCLCAFNFRPLEVAKNVLRAYDTRSSYVHGGVLEASELPSIQKCLDQILDYLRVSLIVFLQMDEKENKERLLNVLHNSMLEAKSRDKLEDKLQNLSVQPPVHV